MKTMFYILMALLTTSTALASSGHNQTSFKKSNNPILKLTGGYIQRPGVRQGSASFLNTQKAVALSEFEPIANKLAKMLHINFTVKEVNAEGQQGLDAVFKNSGDDFAVFIIDDLACNTSLVIFPEKRYAIVNVNALRHDCDGDAFLIARTKKQAIRAFCFVAGGASMSVEGNLMSAFRTVNDLDKVPADAIPVEVIGRIGDYLPKMGCETRAMVTYKKACQEGWAPPPTNDYQKVIWDRVHSIPDKPMTIEFDPKKDKQSTTPATKTTPSK